MEKTLLCLTPNLKTFHVWYLYYAYGYYKDFNNNMFWECKNLRTEVKTIFALKDIINKSFSVSDCVVQAFFMFIWSDI